MQKEAFDYEPFPILQRNNSGNGCKPGFYFIKNAPVQVKLWHCIFVIPLKNLCIPLGKKALYERKYVVQIFLTTLYQYVLQTQTIKGLTFFNHIYFLC